MDVMGIISATALVGGSGLLIGLFLSIASAKLKVEIDEREAMVRELLPGNNCGGCGYAGCDALAKELANGTVTISACPVISSDGAKEVSEVLGVELTESIKKVAFVKCIGTCDKASDKYKYFGELDCNKVSIVPGGGEKSCSFGCLGYASCVKVCKFDAIKIIDKVAVIDKDKCKFCGVCVGICPRNIIEMVPYDSNIKVSCNSMDTGKETKAVCQIGCIGCKLCVKVCEDDAIAVENNIAKIDYDKCTKCGKCADKCPVGVISK